MRGLQLDRDLQHLARETALPEGATAEARSIHTFLLKMKARAVGAQVRVTWGPWKLLTYLDLVVKLENTQETVVVEVKRGCVYRDCRVPHTTSQHLVPALPVKPRHLHELQALAGARLWELQEKQQVHDVWLLYVDEKGLEFTRRSQFGTRWSEGVERVLSQRSA